MPVIEKKDRILQDVLDRVTPTPQEQERTKQLVAEVVSATLRAIKGTRLDHVIAGSFTRDTWMKDKREFDIFIRFPEKTPRKVLEEQGIALGTQIAKSLKGKPTVAYAEHPYVRIKLRDYDVDIVPCFRVASATKIKSAVDRTPFHNEWLSKHFLPELAADVRLLKQFCKGQGIYGSDARTQGFSGYLCELLITQHRTFRKLSEEASSWQAGRVIINLEGIYPVSDPRTLHKKFPGQPLIVIDPVDPGRNVAAALSPENFIRFTKACREFSSKPSSEYFFRKPAKPNIAQIERELRQRRTQLIGFSCRSPDIIDDVLWPQLRRTARRVRDMLEEADFSVLGHGVWTDRRRCFFVFEMEVFGLPRVRRIVGPSIFEDVNSRNFLAKYSSGARVWVEEGCWVAEVRRHVTEASEYLERSLSGSEKDLRSAGMASYLAAQIARSRDMLGKSDILAAARREREFGHFLQDMLEKDVR